jgi:hypothetical protein
MLLQHTRDLKEQHTRAATAQLEVAMQRVTSHTSHVARHTSHANKVARNNTALSRARLAQVQVETERLDDTIVCACFLIVHGLPFP